MASPFQPFCQKGNAKTFQLRSNLRLFFLDLAVFFPELFHPAGRVEQFLLTSKERVAVGADLHVDIFHSGAGLNHIPAGAGYGSLKILGVYAFFH